MLKKIKVDNISDKEKYLLYYKIETLKKLVNKFLNFTQKVNV